MRARLSTVAIVACGALVASQAGALPKVGELRPAVTVLDADDRSFDLRSVNGKPTLVIYEAKEASTQNEALKRELSTLAKGDAYRDKVALVPVADLRGYDFWPAKGFVRDAIRDESKKAGTTIYCDWDGGAARALGAATGKSSVVLLSRTGRVLFSAEGALDEAKRKLLIETLRAEVAAR